VASVLSRSAETIPRGSGTPPPALFHEQVEPAETIDGALDRARDVGLDRHVAAYERCPS
jgi:hypothetical protein